MKTFGKLASAVTITLALSVMGVVPGAAARPAATVSDFDYAGTLGTVETRIARTGNQLEIQVNMRLDCGKTDETWPGLVRTKVNRKTGRFRFVTPAGQREVEIGAHFTDITGRITKSGLVKGRVGMIVSDHFSDNYTCHSGKSVKDFWEKFRARPVDPGRFDIYRFRSKDLRVRFAVEGRKVYVETLRDHRTCTGGPRNWPDGWGGYTSAEPLRARRNGRFALDLSYRDPEGSFRWHLKGRIRRGAITGTFVYAGKSSLDNKNGPLKCSTGKSFADPKVKFEARQVR